MSNRISAVFVVLFGGLAAASMPAIAYATEAWFGLDMPEKRVKRSDRHRAVYQEPDFAPLSLRLPAAEDPYTGIDGHEVHQYVAEIIDVTIAKRPAGEKFWGRIAGSAAEQATAEYIAEKFRDFGLTDVQTEPVNGGSQWWPRDWSVRLIGSPAYGAGTEDYPFESAFPALQLGTGALQIDALEAELIYVGLGQPVDLLNRDLAGKIAVVRAEFMPDPFFQTARGRAEALADAGAVGVIIVVDAPGNHQYALEESGSPHVPCFILGGDDGRFLEEVLAAAGSSAPPMMRLSIDAEIRKSWQGKNVVGMLPGMSDEYLIILAHLDGYFESANDNAGGLASMLALARYFSAAKKLNRTLVFVGTSAHHEFSDGARAFIAAHPDILEKTALVFNIEHPSSIKSYYRGPLALSRGTLPGQLMATTSQGERSVTISNGNQLLTSLYREGIDRYGLVVSAMMERRPNGDAFDFFRAGKIVVQILDANLWFHSSGDRLETIHQNGLERATRLYAYLLDNIDQASWDALDQRNR
ncbi:MAG: M28 family metallopeptidase [Gammaproteobacteria bacterium]|nr:M28 family metallopeptidase [Gammaproteobacteria bacterium]